MKKITSNKAQASLGNQKIILWIIGLIVLIAVILFVKRGDILNYFKNLPDFKTPEGKQVDDVGEDVPVSTSDLQYIIVAHIVEGDKINFCTNEGIVCEGETSSDLLWKVKNGEGTIEIPHWFLIPDKEIGTVTKNVIKINPEFLDKESSEFKKYKTKLVAFKFIKNLDKAYLEGNNYLRKDLEN